MHCITGYLFIDLSFPHVNSVNSGILKEKYLGTPFLFKVPTIDVVTKQVKGLGMGCMLYKVDISLAFRHIKGPQWQSGNTLASHL